MILRPVAALPLPDISAIDLGPRPEIRWVAPTSLLVDETYQRNLSKSSMELLRKAVREFAWAKMKIPNVVEVRGKLHMIDGQHTAIAAATVRAAEIPVFIVIAAEIADRANAFVGLNTDRVTVSKFNLHRAQVAAGDPHSIGVDEVCRRSGVRLRAAINQSSLVAEGDTVAVGVIRSAVKKHGVDRAAKGLAILVKAKRAPISAAEILAIMAVLESPDIDIVQLTRIIRIEGDAGLISAQTQAKVTRAPVWRALIDRWKMKGLSGVRRSA